jgi:RNA polymerase sigma-70 factor (ECF subfamily)
MDQADSVLVMQVQDGDAEAFETLVAKYANLVRSIAYNILGDMDLATDIAQEAFLKVYRKLETLQDPGKFKGWVASITRTTCIDYVRRQRLKTVSLQQVQDAGFEPQITQPGGGNPHVTAEFEELREKVLRAVRNLPKIYQEIIMLRHLRKMSYKEMGSHLGLPQATIESRLYRARLMLKDALKDLYPDQEMINGL